MFRCKRFRMSKFIGVLPKTHRLAFKVLLTRLKPFHSLTQHRPTIPFHRTRFWASSTFHLYSAFDILTSLLLLLYTRCFLSCLVMRVPCERLSRDVLCWLPESMEYPAPLLPSNLMFDWFLVCSFPWCFIAITFLANISLEFFFTKVWIFCSMGVVARHVSDPYTGTLNI